MRESLWQQQPPPQKEKEEKVYEQTFGEVSEKKEEKEE